MTDSEIDTHPLDAPPLDELEDIFELPEALAGNPKFVRWHTEIVARLRREARGVPMKTVQLMLMERISNFYVVMKSMDEDPDATANAKRQALEFWLKMTTEFNRLLEKHNEKILNELLIQIQNILIDVLPKISDKEERQEVRRELISRLNEIEM